MTVFLHRGEFGDDEWNDTMPDTIRHVVERYPDISHEITTLALRDPDFRSTCEDYGKCVEALNHWEQGSDSTSKARADEYRDLCKRIEAEIAETLKS